MYIDWKWNCSAKSQYIWLLCKPGVILFLKVATPTLNTIVKMPPFALLATRAMVPSSACIGQDWSDSCVGLDHVRGRTGFSFKIKNWTVVGPAPSHFFCYHASSHFVHGFPYCLIKVALMETFALQKSFRTEALCWLSKQGWTGWPDKSGAVYSLLTFLSPVQASLSSVLSLFCFWLCCSTCSCIPSKPNIFSQMWACHSHWLEWDVCTHNCGQSMAPRLYTTVKYICYIPQNDLQVSCYSLTLKFCSWLYLPCCVLGRAVS